jgi:hypothetical protein
MAEGWANLRNSENSARELPELYLNEDALADGLKCLTVALKDLRVSLLPQRPDREEDQGVETLLS